MAPKRGVDLYMGSTYKRVNTVDQHMCNIYLSSTIYSNNVKYSKCQLFTLRTRQSSRTLFPLFAAKTSSRIFDGFCKFSNKVAVPESKCFFGNRDGRLTPVAQQQLLLLHVWHFAVSLISQDENNSLLGTNNVPLWEVNMSFQTLAIPSWQLITSLCKEKSPFEAQHLIIHKLNECLCFSDSNCFVNSCSRELSPILTMRIRLRLVIVIHTISEIHLLVNISKKK